jgi:hypothetical protein
MRVESMRVYNEHPLLSNLSSFLYLFTSQISLIRSHISTLPSQCPNQTRNLYEFWSCAKASPSLTADDALSDGNQCGDIAYTALNQAIYFCTCLSLITLHSMSVERFALYVYRSGITRNYIHSTK